MSPLHRAGNRGPGGGSGSPRAREPGSEAGRAEVQCAGGEVAPKAPGGALERPGREFRQRCSQKPGGLGGPTPLFCLCRGDAQLGARGGSERKVPRPTGSTGCSQACPAPEHQPAGALAAAGTCPQAEVCVAWKAGEEGAGIHIPAPGELVWPGLVLLSPAGRLLGALGSFPLPAQLCSCAGTLKPQDVPSPPPAVTPRGGCPGPCWVQDETPVPRGARGWGRRQSRSSREGPGRESPPRPPHDTQQAVLAVAAGVDRHHWPLVDGGWDAALSRSAQDGPAGRLQRAVFPEEAGGGQGRPLRGGDVACRDQPFHTGHRSAPAA